MFRIFRRPRSRILALSAALALSVPVVARASRVSSHPAATQPPAPPVATLVGEGFWEITRCSACLGGAFLNALVDGSTPAASAAGGGDFLACEMACLRGALAIF